MGSVQIDKPQVAPVKVDKDELDALDALEKEASEFNKAGGSAAVSRLPLHTPH